MVLLLYFFFLPRLDRPVLGVANRQMGNTLFPEEVEFARVVQQPTAMASTAKYGGGIPKARTTHMFISADRSSVRIVVHVWEPHETLGKPLTQPQEVVLSVSSIVAPVELRDNIAFRSRDIDLHGCDFPCVEYILFRGLGARQDKPFDDVGKLEIRNDNNQARAYVYALLGRAVSQTKCATSH